MISTPTSIQPELSTELVFTTKTDEPCDECSKKSEVNLELPLYSYDEYLKVKELLNKYKISREEMDYIYNFYNRVFKTNKKPGCGKCLKNISKHLTHRFESES
jgi:hypothetical protein